MTPERWQQVKGALSEVLQASADQRAAVLDRVCAGDEELRREVLSLLAASHDDDSADDEMRRAVMVEARHLNAAQRTNETDQLRATLQTNLNESYEILSTLGTGGMGTVFLARERMLDRYVAIKTLRNEQAVTGHHRERFRREARIAAQLSHPGILPLYAFGEVSGMWYLVMGYVRGQTLAQRIHSEGRLHATEAWRILRAVSDALEHAHQRQVIHRDIKPANILIDSESGRVLLADFGISKAIGESDGLTRTGDVMGTPHFMSPEQLTSAQDCDARSDVYSLGAVAYAMLTGGAPLAELRGSELLARRSASEIPPLTSLNPSVPGDFAAVIMRCLANNPAERWQSARQLCDALDRVDHSVDAAFSPALREFAGFGSYAVAWFTLWAGLALMARTLPRLSIPLLLMSLLVPIGLALQVSRTLTPSTGWQQLRAVAFWPPLWWGMWWPAGWRRPGDLWRRLPWPARAVRIVISASVIALPLLPFAIALVTASWFQSKLSFTVAEFDALWYVTYGTLAVSVVGTIIGATFWIRRFKLAPGDSMQFLIGPTAPSAFWRQREIARALKFDSPGIRPPALDLPSDYVRAMQDLKLQSTPEIASVVEMPIGMARRLATSIASLDREIAVLNRDASPEESARVAARLAALTENVTTIRDEHQALIDIVQRELELLRRMNHRKLLAQNEQMRLFDLLREMWAELVRLTDGAGNHAHTAARVSELMEQGAALLASQHPPTPNGKT